jgi:hypothetical protein
MKEIHPDNYLAAEHMGLLTKISINVPGLHRKHLDSDGRVLPGRAGDKLVQKLLDSESSKGGEPAQVNWRHVESEVRIGRVTGKFVVGASTVAIFLAAAGVELGLRDGIDIENLFDAVRNAREKR